MSFSKKDISFFFLSTLLLGISVVTFLVDDKSKIISLVGFFITASFIFKFSKSIPLLIIFLFFLTYNIDSIKFFYTNIDLTAFPDFQQKDIVNKALVLNGLFVFSLGNYIPSKITENKVSVLDSSISNRFFFWLTFSVCVLILLFAIKGDSIFSGGLYGDAEKSPLNEYFILLYLLLFLVTPQRFLYKSILYSLGLLYCIKNLLFGGRIEVLQLFLLVFYLLFVLERKVKISAFYFFVLGGFYFNFVMEAIRSNPISFISGNYLDFLNPTNLVFTDNGLTYLASNQGDVLQSSGRILGLIQEGFLTYWQRILSFLSFIVSFFIPSKFLPDYANLASYKQDLFRSGGGGLIAVYFYAWLGIIGPVISGGFIGYFIRSLYANKSIYYKLYGLCLLITFPRWYAYNPIGLIKFCLYSVILFFVVTILSKNYKNDSCYSA